MKINEHNVNLLLSAIAASLAVLSFGVLIVYRASLAQEIRDQGMSNCLAIEQLKTRIREGIVDRRDTALREPGLDVSVQVAIRVYYKRAVKRYSPQSC